MNQKQSWEEDFVEKGAELEHTRWAKWQEYFFSKCKILEYQEEVSLVLPRGLYDRWKRQIETPYSELSESEKESDRKETREYLPLVKQAIQTREREISEEVGKKSSNGVVDSHAWIFVKEVLSIINNK